MRCSPAPPSSSITSRRQGETVAVYVRPHVLVVDEVGYLAYSDDAANVLYHVVNDRHIRRRSMIFTTNKHPKRWGAALHDEDLAEAIVDRILERGRLLRLDGRPSERSTCPKTSSIMMFTPTQPAAEFLEKLPQSFRNAHLPARHLPTHNSRCSMNSASASGSEAE